jgi:hypothetical protein
MNKGTQDSALEQNDYLKAFAELAAKGDEIVDWKITRSLEEAKLLSINVEFQRATDEIRERWRIEPRVQTRLVDPGAVLYKYSEHLSEADRELLEKDLEDLADKFDLDWTDEGEDYGLIVGALCYRLTPSNLIHHWDEIKYSVSKTRTPGVRIFLNHRRDAVDNFIQSIVIAYLFLQLNEAGIEVELTAPIKKVIRETLTRLGKLGQTSERATQAIERLQQADIPTDVMIKIDRNTTMEDIRRTWPQIEMRKVEWLQGEGKRRSKKSRNRIWRTFERDVFVWRRVKRDCFTYENAYNEWLSTHPGEEAVEITAVIKAVKKIKDIPDD